MRYLDDKGLDIHLSSKFDMKGKSMLTSTMKPDLKTWLNKKKWTTSELAEKAGVSRATISYIINGRTDAKIETIMAVYKATGYEVRLASLSKPLSEFMDLSHK